MGYFTFKLKSNGAVLHLVPPFALYTHIPYDSLHFHAISGHSSCILSGDGGLRRTRSSLSARLVDPVGVGGELGATPNDLRSKKDWRDRPLKDPLILFIRCRPPPPGRHDNRKRAEWIQNGK